MAPGGLGTPKIDHEPYIWTDFFPVSSNSIVIGPFSTHFSVRGVGGPMYAIVYPEVRFQHVIPRFQHLHNRRGLEVRGAVDGGPLLEDRGDVGMHDPAHWPQSIFCRTHPGGQGEDINAPRPRRRGARPPDPSRGPGSHLRPWRRGRGGIDILSLAHV